MRRPQHNMAQGAPKAPVVAEAHEVDTFRESCSLHPAPGAEACALAGARTSGAALLTTSVTDPPQKMLDSTWSWADASGESYGGNYC